MREIKFIASFMGEECYGDDNAVAMLDWYKDRLDEEMRKNVKLEIENFSLSIKPKLNWFKRLLSKTI